MESLDAQIDLTPGVAGGKPRIAGHQTKVQDIARWHVRMGRSPDEISTGYDLGLADVYAALAYYHDPRAEIDERKPAAQASAKALRQQIPSKVSGKLGGRKS